MRSRAFAFARSIADTAGCGGGGGGGIAPGYELVAALSVRGTERSRDKEGNAGKVGLARRASAAENQNRRRPAISSKCRRSNKRASKNTRSLTCRLRKPVALNASFHPVR